MAFRFKKFRIYQDAKEFHIRIFILTSSWNYKLNYLADQIRRSSLSVVLNIAEGSSRQSDKDFNKFIAIALGSLDETAACLDIALDLKIISPFEYNQLLESYTRLSNQLGKLSKKLKSTARS